LLSNSRWKCHRRKSSGESSSVQRANIPHSRKRQASSLAIKGKLDPPPGAAKFRCRTVEGNWLFLSLPFRTAAPHIVETRKCKDQAQRGFALWPMLLDLFARRTLAASNRDKPPETVSESSFHKSEINGSLACMCCSAAAGLNLDAENLDVLARAPR